MPLRLSYNVFDTFNFDLYATIWCQAVDLSFGSAASFHVVTGVASNWVRFAHATCGDFVCRDTFGDQVVNNALSTFFRQFLVVLSQNRYGR